jgi:Protein of unknown function (DUF2568)
MSTEGRSLSGIQAVTLVLRVTMEIGIVAALAFWGATTPASTWLSVALGIGAPLVGFGIWGAVDFRRAGRYGEPLRLVEELVISLLAAAALDAAGRPVLAVALALLSIGYHALVYATGARLLDHDATAA